MTDDVTMHDVIAHNQVSSFADIRRPAAYCCQDIPPVPEVPPLPPKAQP